MLIVSRKQGEVIEIGDGIKITFLGMQRNLARIGIDAPRDVPVFRSEIAERIRKEQAECGVVDSPISTEVHR